MLPQRVQVLKRDKIEVSGSIRLTPAAGVHPVRTPNSSRMSPLTPGMAQQARIIESNNEYAIIEITCSCGCKSHIQCNFGNS